MPEWTPEQKNAIESRNGTILVSAAAGSGKTAVLVERVIQRLMDKENPCSADELLIVTFTRAATQQMKERIYNAITKELKKDPENNHLKKQLLMLPFANIQTIDSFCNNIVRENFHRLDIAPDYKLLDNSQLKILQTDTVNRVMDELYKENSPEFTELINIMSSGTNDSSVTELILSLYTNSCAFAQPEKWLDSLSLPYETELPLIETQWGRIIANEIKEIATYICNCAIYVLNEFKEDETVKERYYECIYYIYTTFLNLSKLTESGSWDNLRKSIQNIELPKFGRLPNGYVSEIADDAKNLRKDVAKLNEKMLSYLCVTEDEHNDDMQYLKPIAEKVVEAVKMFSKLLLEEKKKINSYDFSDISQFAIQLLINYNKDGTAEKTDIALSFSQKFKEILVDEYQDINDMQDQLFAAVSKSESNLFMVGDVKQSIYRFRQAMPEIFIKRRQSLTDYTKGHYPAKITLDRNFRSRSGVTENVNFVFRNLMSRELGDVKYDKSEELVASAEYNKAEFPQTEFSIVGDMINGEKVSREIEAQYIADKINEIVHKEKMQVKDGEDYRPIKFKDICILMRSTANKAEIYAEALTQNNIPVHISSQSGFFESPEISTILNLIRIIDNPIQDIPMLAVMLSPLFGFTPDELAQIRIDSKNVPIYKCIVNAAENGNAKCDRFLYQLENLRMLGSTLQCSQFIWELYEQTGCKAIAQAMDDGEHRNANLNLLAEYAAKYEETGKRGISGFIRYIDKIKRQGGNLESASEISEYANVVRIMTIHKSKGLEFPVCILADLSGQFFDDTKNIASFHPDLGICFDRRDARTKCSFKTVGKKAIAIAEKRSAYSENLRVLYVAMTRAKERLICVSRLDKIVKNVNKSVIGILANDGITPYMIKSKNNFSDWILQAFLSHPDANVIRAETVSPKLKMQEFEEHLVINLVDKVSDRYVKEKEESGGFACDETLLEEIRKRTGYKYPYASLGQIKAKSAPSEFESNGFDVEYFAKTKPQFLSKSGINPADRGTATHKFMEFFDYESNLDFDAQLDKMVAENRLTPNEANAIEKDKVSRFFTSDIAKRIKSSPALMREKKVTVGIPAGKLYPDINESAKSETVVIQGFVDCAFEENGKLIIVDYKTDKGVDMQTLRQRYSTQLKMYEYALHECTGMEIAGTLIYSFENGEFIEL